MKKEGELLAWKCYKCDPDDPCIFKCYDAIEPEFCPVDGDNNAVWEDDI